MKNKKFVLENFRLLIRSMKINFLSILILLIVFSGLMPAQPDQPIASERLGFLYLLYDFSDPVLKTITYKVKVFDPHAREVREITKAVVPSDFNT